MDRDTPDFGTLFVVATPIGNRDDLAPRARQVLREVDFVAAEDTRHTGRFLSHFGIATPLLAFHDHNETQQCAALIGRLEGGENAALVSDAGTPLISDPGYRLVTAAHAAGIRVVPVPGPSAVVAALSASGLPTDRFAFEGFPPARADARRARFDAVAGECRTLVFLESVHKIKASVDDMVHAFGPARPAFIGREMTKLHEQCVSASLGELAAMLADGSIPAKGEFVVVIGGAADTGPEARDVDRLLTALLRALPGKQAVAIAAEATGIKRNQLYERMLKLRAAD